MAAEEVPLEEPAWTKEEAEEALSEEQAWKGHCSKTKSCSRQAHCCHCCCSTKEEALAATDAEGTEGKEEARMVEVASAEPRAED